VDGASRPLSEGESFEVAGTALTLRRAPAEATQTEGLEPGLGYRLEVSLNGPTGARAVVRDPRTGAEHVVTSEVRATLLFVLARAVVVQAEASPEDRGWMHDDDVASGIWGRERFAQEANNYHVLIHRVRKELEAAGFDPWFVEKKRKHLRLNLHDVRVE
jgi:hypothetical protein